MPNPTGGSRAHSLPKHCCTSAKGPQAPALTTLPYVIVWPRLLAQLVRDPPTPILIKNARPPTQVCTCSLVVRPRVTSTTWKPVRPTTGMKKRPATHMTAMLAR